MWWSRYQYRKTLEYLYQQFPVFHRDGNKAYRPGLTTINSLLRYLNHPHRKYPSVHIAGTNGKGSVSHMIASVLQEAGYKTGLYTSPHLSDFRERIKINGKGIPKERVVDFFKEYKNELHSLNPSFFEITTAMAFDYFAKEKVDVAVIETGLGGRLDSTNVLYPILSIITNIGKDHTEILGNNLHDIAREKAGIIKYKIPVVIGQSQPDFKHIFEVKAGIEKAPLFIADRRLSLTAITTASDFSYFEADVEEHHHPLFHRLRTDLTGLYQQKNMLTALQALLILRDRFPFSEKALYDGMARVKSNTGLKGRWDILGHAPLIIADAAHNPDGLDFSIRQVTAIPHNTLHIVFGVAKDKDIADMLSLMPTGASYYFTRAGSPRAMDENELMNQALHHGLKGNCFPNVNKALKEAKKQAQPGDVILVTGSIYLLGDLKEMND